MVVTPGPSGLKHCIEESKKIKPKILGSHPGRTHFRYLVFEPLQGQLRPLEERELPDVEIVFRFNPLLGSALLDS